MSENYVALPSGDQKKEGGRSPPLKFGANRYLVSQRLDTEAALESADAGGRELKGQIAGPKVAQAEVGHCCISMSVLEVAEGDHVPLEAGENARSHYRPYLSRRHAGEAIRAAYRVGDSIAPVYNGLADGVARGGNA